MFNSNNHEVQLLQAKKKMKIQEELVEDEELAMEVEEGEIVLQSRP